MQLSIGLVLVQAGATNPTLKPPAGDLFLRGEGKSALRPTWPAPGTFPPFFVACGAFSALEKHYQQCLYHHPPGDEIYRDEANGIRCAPKQANASLPCQHR